MDYYLRLFKLCEYEQPGLIKSFFYPQQEQVCHYQFIEVIEQCHSYLMPLLQIFLLVLVIRLSLNVSVKFFNSIFIWLKRKHEIIQNKRLKKNCKENGAQNEPECDLTNSEMTPQKFSYRNENSSDEMAEELINQLDSYLDHLNDVPNYSKSSTY